ncbi:bifunctional adenosylcobinamide kinase/adenosylcobinamide-phosphate guanylyltransferase [Polycladomyces subterraneus]|uniref:Adenosylcobinamide kinase n=1 Tax=Polycladomyces subterraneus TaxID=1016997 RepID=A0ABT8ILZ6_9BACL|nr:bifunctional adenosylcobinamide kinase/adenosylcobinamide-phosphate guanylyltransferase [Polycladomyces subterraneus]MDN4593810.1 bifunctional adenosylcobinamide kinase/adenosylcobinamide-phosphate guanylyltransferase [Polycladomyces subterraneus]
MSVVMVTGGVRSGKSAFAEEICRSWGGRVLYVATGGTPRDEEMRARVELHRQRRPHDWGLIEEPLEPQKWLSHPEPYDIVLIDSLSAWVANRVMNVDESDREQFRRLPEELETEWHRLLPCFGRQKTVIVTDETGLGGVALSPMGRLFQETLGRVNQLTARFADEVWMVVSGIPWRLKG